MPLVGEVERVAVTAAGRLAVEKVQALIAEVAAGMVVDDIEDDRQAMQVTQVHESLELIHLAAQVFEPVAPQPPGVQQLIHRVGIGRQLVVLDGEIHFRREVIGAVVAEAERGLELLYGQELDGRDAQLREIRHLARDIEKRAPLPRQVGCEEGPDVELIDDDVVEPRRHEPVVMPGEVRAADDALARERRLELARVRIALRAFAALTDDVEHVPVAIPRAGDESPPVSALVTRQQARVAPLAVVELADAREPCAHAAPRRGRWRHRQPAWPPSGYRDECGRARRARRPPERILRQWRRRRSPGP